MARVSNFYSMSYREVMEMPVRAFWVFSKNINRISAERDMRLLVVMASSQSGAAFEELQAALKDENDRPSVSVDNSRDPDAFNKLRNALA